MGSIFDYSAKVNKVKELLSRKKVIWKLVFFLTFLSDFGIYLISYPSNTLRYSRFVRPFILITYSKELRRSVKGILYSGKSLVILLLF